MKQLLSGNEAIARGIWEAGIKVASAYPGTPSTEVIENLPQYRDDIYCEWAPNEKVALEVAYGAAVAGSRSVTVPVPDGSVQRIGVDRLVCKAGIRKVAVQFTDPGLAARPFRLKGIYLTNCYGKSRYGSDWTAEGILSDASAWYNRMGFHSEAGVDGLLAETGLDIPVTADRPHAQEHVFYYYPNPLPASLDTRSGTWTRRKTRLVLEAQVGDRTYYYPVTLPESQRNRTYLIEEAVIRKLGSLDPEQDEPGAIEVTFSTSPDDWSPDYPVTEIS
jgi:hypothetical protein